jgi:quinol monooxygenase YgiN
MAEFTVKTDHIEEVIKLVQEFIESVKKNEPEVLRYESFHDQGGNRFFHIMCFKDRKAESVHQQAFHTLNFVKKLYPLCEKEPLFTTIIPNEGKV